MKIKFYNLHEETFLLFVYGTLKKNNKYNYMLENSKMVSKGVTLDKYPMIDAEYYPYIYFEKDKGFNVKGELYRVSLELLNRLDIFEGNEYIRKEIKIKKIDNEFNQIVDAYVYFSNPLNQHKIDFDNRILIEEW